MQELEASGNLTKKNYYLTRHSKADDISNFDDATRNLGLFSISLHLKITPVWRLSKL